MVQMRTGKIGLRKFLSAPDVRDARCGCRRGEEIVRHVILTEALAGFSRRNGAARAGDKECCEKTFYRTIEGTIPPTEHALICARLRKKLPQIARISVWDFSEFGGFQSLLAAQGTIKSSLQAWNSKILLEDK